MILDCFEHKMQNHFIKIEFEKVANFLDTISDDKDLPRFFTKKWVEVYDQSGGNYNVNKEIRIKTSKFTADDFEAPNNTAASATATNNANNNAFGEKMLVFKNNASFINCISKINGVKIDNAED